MTGNGSKRVLLRHPPKKHLAVSKGQVYRSTRHLVRVEMVRSGGEGRSPYAFVNEITKNGKLPRGDRNGIPRDLPIKVCLTFNMELGWVMPPGYTLVEEPATR